MKDHNKKRSRGMYSNLLNQFDLERKSRRNRKKPKRLVRNNVTNSAILSLCLVTGLSVGVSSAFADGELAPEQAPIDQPASKNKVELNQPKPRDDIMERTPVEHLPQEPQIEKPSKKPQAKIETPDLNTSIPKEQVPVEPMPKKEQQPTKITPPEALGIRSASKELQPGGQPVEEKKNDQSLVQSRLNNHTNKEKPTIKKEFNTGSISKSVHNYSARAEEQQSKPSKYKLGKGIADATSPRSSQILVASKGTPAKKASNVKTTAHPKTVNGGQLPKTAGNDLNGVVAGSVMALLGTLYSIRRKVKKT